MKYLRDKKDLADILRIGRDIAAVAATVGTAYNWTRDLRGRYRMYQNRHDYTVSIYDEDIMFDRFLKWFKSNFDDAEFKSWIASTYTDHTGGGNGKYRYKREVRPRPAYWRNRTVEVYGHPVEVRWDVETKETKEKESKNTISITTNDKTRWILRAKTFEGYEAIIKLLDSFRAEMEDAEGIGVFVAGGMLGNWSYVPGAPARHLDTIIMDDEEKQAVVSDIKTFLDNKERYDTLGIPWHRGYLLYGPPGTGKTSLVRAIATEFNLDLYTLKPNDYDSEGGLERVIFSIPPNSILLLEDVDTANVAKDRDAKDKGKSFKLTSVGAGALLNAIDGVATPNGLITIMTSNYPEKLDEALIRSGRIDMQIEVSYLNRAGLSQIVKLAYDVDHDFMDIPVRSDVVPSDVLDIVKRHMYDPDMGIKLIEEFVYGGN